MSDFEDFFHFRSKADYLHCSAVLDHRDVDAREFADPRTIQIDQATKIENDIFPLRFQKRLNGLTQGSDFEKSQMSGHVNQGHLIAMADFHRKAHEKQPFRLHGNYNPTVHKRLPRNLPLADSMGAAIYCRRTTDRPLRQDSASPTRTTCIWGFRQRRRISVAGSKRSAGATKYTTAGAGC